MCANRKFYLQKKILYIFVVYVCACVCVLYEAKEIAVGCIRPIIQKKMRKGHMEL